MIRLRKNDLMAVKIGYTIYNSVPELGTVHYSEKYYVEIRNELITHVSKQILHGALKDMFTKAHPEILVRDEDEVFIFEQHPVLERDATRIGFRLRMAVEVEIDNREVVVLKTTTVLAKTLGELA